MKGKLTDKQKRFVEEYLICLNATEAAIKAGYSKKTAYSQGQRLLKNVEVQKVVSEKQNKLQDKLEVTQERVIAEYAKVAFSQLPGIIHYKDGSITIENFDKLTNEQKACIKKFKFTTVYEIGADGEPVPINKVTIDLHDKLKALDSLARHLGMFNGKPGAEGEGVSQTVYNFIIKGKDEK